MDFLLVWPTSKRGYVQHLNKNFGYRGMTQRCSGLLWSTCDVLHTACLCLSYAPKRGKSVFRTVRKIISINRIDTTNASTRFPSSFGAVRVHNEKKPTHRDGAFLFLRPPVHVIIQPCTTNAEATTAARTVRFPEQKWRVPVPLLRLSRTINSELVKLQHYSSIGGDFEERTKLPTALNITLEV